MRIYSSTLTLPTSGSKEESLLVVDPFGRKSNKYSSTHPQQPMFRLHAVFPVSGQFEAAKLTHFSTAPLRTPTIPRFKRSLLTCGDVQPNPGPTTQYPCPVCTRNVTSRGVSYLCHSCSGWVHSKCSNLKDARQYKRTKDWACKTCSSAPAPPPTQPPPAPTTTSKPKDDTFNILQFNANGIGNKLSELERFLEKHNVKVAAIQESKLTSKSRNPSIKNFTTVRETDHKAKEEDY